MHPWWSSGRFLTQLLPLAVHSLSFPLLPSFCVDQWCFHSKNFTAPLQRLSGSPQIHGPQPGAHHLCLTLAAGSANLHLFMWPQLNALLAMLVPLLQKWFREWYNMPGQMESTHIVLKTNKKHLFSKYTEVYASNSLSLIRRLAEAHS